MESTAVGSDGGGQRPFDDLLAEVDVMLADAPKVSTDQQEERQALDSPSETAPSSSAVGGSSPVAEPKDNLRAFLDALDADSGETDERIHLTQPMDAAGERDTVEDAAVVAPETETLQAIDKKEEAERIWEAFKNGGGIERTQQGVEVNMIALTQRMRQLQNRHRELDDVLQSERTLPENDLKEFQQTKVELRFGMNFISSAHTSLLGQLFELPPVDMMTDAEYDALAALSWHLTFDGVDSPDTLAWFSELQASIAEDNELPKSTREGKVHSLTGIHLPGGFMSTKNLDFRRFMKYYDQEVLGKMQYFYRDGERAVHSRYGLVKSTPGAERLAQQVQQEREHVEALWWVNPLSFHNGWRSRESLSRPITEDERTHTLKENTYTQKGLSELLQRGLKETPKDVLRKLRVHRVFDGNFVSGKGQELEWIRRILQESDPANMPGKSYGAIETTLVDYIDRSQVELGSAEISQLAQDIAILSLHDTLQPGEKFALLVPPTYNLAEIHALFPEIPLIGQDANEGFARSLVDAYVELLQEGDPAAKRDSNPYDIFTPSESTLTGGSGRHFAFGSRHRGIIGLTASVDARNPAYQSQFAEIAGVAYFESMLRDTATLEEAQQNMRKAKRASTLKSLLKGEIPDTTALQVLSDGQGHHIAVINRYGNQVVYQVTPDGEVVLLTPPGDKKSLAHPRKQVEIVQPIQKGSMLIISPGEIPPVIWATAVKEKKGFGEAVVNLGIQMAQKQLNRQQLTAVAMEVN